MEDLLKAGPELDKMIHIQVVGGGGEAPPYSTDMTFAWSLFRQMPRPKRLHVDEAGVHHCMCGGSDQGACEAIRSVVWEKSTKMAHVICLAALKAKALGLKKTP
ncbi:MAG: hypothetical protein M1418_05290 [Deltaproteobacteria bacterium]|nr:hypothetical protein [Deltaproteobacteria bacterium]